MEDRKKRGKKRPYEKPRICFEEKIEILATACGGIKDEKDSGGENPNYATPCGYVHS